jgi:hypothetical protein
MHVGEGRTSARPSSLAAGGVDARVSGRGVVSWRSGSSERSLSSGRGASVMGVVRRGGGDEDRGSEVRGGDLMENV